MTIQAGQMLLHYRVVAKIGSGGMGEVWSAEDTKLGRTIAIKTLPPWTADDERLRARFEQEARAVAALNHPNIVTAHSVDDADGVLFMTMELVEGQSLSRILKDRLPFERFFALALPLSDAVAAAHEAGILHRDLKPDNVMVSESGALKVLDFGLAKLREDPAAAPADGPTGEEKTAGSAASMSPEQAEGKAVGPPSDIFSIGILLYRMACGRHPFSGGTAIAMISAILKDDPPAVTEYAPDLPRHLGRIIHRCLAKDPARRYTSARNLHLDLELLRDELAETRGHEPTTKPRRTRTWVGVALVSGLVLALVAAAGWLRSPGAAGAAIAMEVSQQTFDGGVETNPTLSPNGEYLAYEAVSPDGDSDIFLQRVDGHNPINLTADSEVFDGAPVFSPDGTRIAFRSNREVGGIYVMGATGEDVRRVTEFGYDPTWSPDGTQIAFATEAIDSPLLRYVRSTLWVADVATGATRQIYDRDAVQPSWSPNGKRIAFWTVYADEPKAGQRDLGTVRPDGSDPLLIDDSLALDWRPVWAPDGKALFFASDRGGSMNLWRVGFDEQTGTVQGAAEPLTTPAVWSGPFAVSADGTRIAYVARDESARLLGVDFDPRQATTVGEPYAVTRGSLLVFSWDDSPDGEWVAFSTNGRKEDLYLVRRDGSELRMVTDDLDKDRGVNWLDDQRLVFYSNQGGGYEIWTIRRDGSQRRQLTQTSGGTHWMPQVSPDGTQMLTHNAEGTYLFTLEGDAVLRSEQARHLASAESDGGNFRGVRWSPDGSRILGTVYETLSATAVAVYDLKQDKLSVFREPSGSNSMAGGWFPEGQRFIATADGAAWVVDLASASWSRLPLKVGPEVGPGGGAKLTRDGRTLHYMQTDTETDIWLARMR